MKATRHTAETRLSETERRKPVSLSSPLLSSCVKKKRGVRPFNSSRSTTAVCLFFFCHGSCNSQQQQQFHLGALCVPLITVQRCVNSHKGDSLSARNSGRKKRREREKKKPKREEEETPVPSSILCRQNVASMARVVCFTRIFSRHFHVREPREDEGGGQNGKRKRKTKGKRAAKRIAVSWARALAAY